MNRNLPHAVKVVRQVLASSGSDPAAAIAHALDAAGFLVDPEKTYGDVLGLRTGGWSGAVDRTTTPALAREPEAPKEHPENTELEAQALAWDQACERARRVADVIRRHVGEHPAFQNLQLDGDRILVSLHILNQAQWGEWRRYFGITHDTEKPLPYVVGGDGYRDGVRVSVLAYDLPESRKRALASAKSPFEFEGIVYDLAFPQLDASGDVWFFQGERTPAGMPLLSLDGRPERCTMANLIRQLGPLTAVTGTPSQQATPVMTGTEGGEGA